MCTSSMKKCVINIASHHMSSKMRARHKHATWQQNNIVISSQIQNNENLNVKMIIRSKKRQIINSNLEKQAKKLTSSDKRIKNKTSWADLKRNKIKRKKNGLKKYNTWGFAQYTIVIFVKRVSPWLQNLV